MATKRVIVTGAAGFVGANLAQRLVQDGHETHLIARDDADLWRLTEILGHAQIHSVALEDAESVRRAVAAVRPDWVFHVAAHGGYSWQSDARRMIDSNVLGTMNLLRACHESGFESFVNTGSSSEYGFKNHPPAEDELLEPNSDYAVTKACATMFCRYAAVARMERVATLRLYSVYGPLEEPRRLIPTLIVRGLVGELPPLADPIVARDYVFVDDVVDAYLLAASRAGDEPGAVYNVGSGVQTSLREIVEVARRALRIPMEPQWSTMPNRMWDTSVWVADNRKTRSQLGWQPRSSLVEGFEKLIEWFRCHPDMERFYRDRVPAT